MEKNTFFFHHVAIWIKFNDDNFCYTRSDLLQLSSDLFIWTNKINISSDSS